MLSKLVNLSNLTLLVALALSTVAAYYSIIGLTAIFAGAVIPIIVMGSILEIGKITTTVWLRKYWHRCTWVLKWYLVPAVILLALLTSMGIFGFLSKAHMDQGITSGDSQAKLSLYDEKIKTQRENIELARKALQQMDAQVDARLNRSDSETGAERAVQIRRQQQSERAKLQKEIGDAQKEIAKLNEERAPIAAENRKIEAEVGPIKYIAALIYGDNTDQNMLESAVRWVIILIVIVFDPLAIALVLAANASKEWDKEVVEESTPLYVVDVGEKPTPEELKEIDEFVEQVAQETLNEVEEKEVAKDPAPVGWMYSQVVKKPKKEKKQRKPKQKVEEPLVEPVVTETVSSKIQDEYVINTTPEHVVEVLEGDYVAYKGKHMTKNVLRNRHPELFAEADKTIENGYGTTFPIMAKIGDLFVRTDVVPNKVFKFNGWKWMEINRDTTGSYLDNDEYLGFLVDKISSGEYDLEILTEYEQDAIRNFMAKQINQKS